VDDPWNATRGEPARTDTNLAMIALAWLVLGMPLAFHKAMRGASLSWVGIKITVDSEGARVIAEVPEEKVTELRLLTAQMLDGNVVAISAMRTYTGKMEPIASLLYAIKPFVQPLWAALYDDRSRAPRGACGPSQCVSPCCGCNPSCSWKVRDRFEGCSPWLPT